jgi:hypothetical protein
MYVYVRLCVCACLYVCVYVSMHTCMYVCACIYVRVCMYMRVCNVYVRVYVYVCTYVCGCVYVCMYICMCVLVCMCVCMYAYMHVCVCVYACICVYVCIVHVAKYVKFNAALVCGQPMCSHTSGWLYGRQSVSQFCSSSNSVMWFLWSQLLQSWRCNAFQLWRLVIKFVCVFIYRNSFNMLACLFSYLSNKFSCNVFFLFLVFRTPISSCNTHYFLSVTQFPSVPHVPCVFLPRNTVSTSRNEKNGLQSMFRIHYRISLTLRDRCFSTRYYSWFSVVEFELFCLGNI